jgi:hypothetical protein
LYAVALAAYALQKAGHASATDFRKKLDKIAIEKEGFKWWEYYPPYDNHYYWLGMTHTINVEITAMALTIYMDTGLYTDAFLVLQWLIKQRNNLYGYHFTDYLTIEALTKMASKLYVSDQDINVKVIYGINGEYNAKVDRNNEYAMQKYELPLGVNNIKFQCRGKGFAFAHVAYMYYVVVPEPSPSFNLDIAIRDSLSAANLKLTICTSFIVDDKASQSGLTIVEVAFPSGYTFNKDTLKTLKTTNDVSVNYPVTNKILSHEIIIFKHF